MTRLVVGITGATGSIYGIRLLELLRATPGVELPPGDLRRAASAPSSRRPTTACADVEALATRRYDDRDIGASLASGSFKTDGMVIAPCTIKTAGAVAACSPTRSIARAADVTLKEGRPLILVVRETPLHLGHLRVLTALAEMGAVILPPMPAFYNRPKQIDDIVDHTLGAGARPARLPQSLVAGVAGCVHARAAGRPAAEPAARP